jgi:N-acetylmuramoyl-L-alanine amidase
MRFRAISKSLVTFCLIIIYSNPCIAKSDNEVVSIEVNSSESGTTVRIKFSQKVSYSWKKIASPNRVYFDFENLELNAILESIADQISPANRPLLAAKAARNTPDKTRLVFTLEEGFFPEVTYSKTSNEITLLASIAEGNLDPIENFYNTDVDIGSNENPENSPITKLDKFTIAIDPGHGGKDPGAIGFSGTKEKDITLAIASKLAHLINKEQNMQAVLTRTNDIYVPLRGRIEKLKPLSPQIFISIHADAAQNKKAEGSSVFVLSEKGETSIYARMVASKENDVDLIFGENFADRPLYEKKTLIDLTQTMTSELSVELATSVLKNLGKVNSLHKKNVEKAAFAVLKSINICSILVETAFLSNPDEERDLKKDKYQEQLAMAILDGLKNFLKETKPERFGYAIAEN